MRVIVCPNCGKENPEGFQFCGFCTAPLQPTAPEPRDVRKTVTVVFTDVTGSTSLGEQLDPESLRRVMGRYFDEMRAVLERHGGTVEKFIGDAVMAVFGIPKLHEDDALRAVRAAWEMRAALDALNAQLEPELGVTIAVRTGVNTGEVVAGDASAGQTLVTGDAVNVAARLEQAAAAGEILIGPATHRLVRDAVEVESLEPLPLKGKEEPVPAFRLTSVAPGAAGTARHLDSPMVGRDRELDLLRWAFDRSVEERTCHLMTVLGPAGVGKSRLVEEFLTRHAAEAAVLRGRCLPYGEGITYWPIIEAAKEAAGITDDDQPDSARAKLAALVEGEERAELIHRRVAQVIGLAANSAVPEETFWGIRSLFEAVARRRPLVLLLDDIHWAEPTLLDLIEHIADWSRDAPILLMCLARQELLELRAGWGGGKVNASTILLESLNDQDCERLIENLLGRADLPTEALRRIEDAAEGNPLFVEEMVGMLIDDGLVRPSNGGWAATGDLSNVAVPPTIQALLAARLDRLEREERSVIEGASVIGRVFYRGAVAALSSDEIRPTVPGRLATLVRRELIRPDRSDFAGEDAYRFRHMLIRDSAYESMPKEARAELHERFATWLEASVGDRAREYEEILGHHLEQAHRYLTELGLSGDRTRDLGRKAGSYLTSAGGRAEARGDVRGAANLLTRASNLLPKDEPERARMLPPLARALLEAGEFGRGRAIVSEALEEALRLGDRSVELQARAASIMDRVSTDPQMSFGEALAESERIATLAGELDDPATLARAWGVVGQLRSWAGNTAGAQEAGRRGLEAARAGGIVDILPELLAPEFSAVVWGPVTVSEGLRYWEPIFEEGGGGLAMHFAEIALAVLKAMSGEVVEAHALAERGLKTLENLGMKVHVEAPHWRAMVHLLNGQPELAEAVLRPGIDVLRSMGETGFLSTSASMVAEAAYRQQNYADAEAFAQMSREATAAGDVASEVGWRAVMAKVRARQDRHEEAERLVREALAMLEPTDTLPQRGDTLLDLAEVLRLAGRREEALAAAREALSTYEQKEDVASATRAKAVIAELKPEA